MNSLNRDWEEFEKLLYTYFRCGECEVASEKQGKEVFCVNCQWDKEQLCDKFSQAILSAKEEAKAEEREEICNTKLEEPPEGVEGLSDKRQAFLAGQINMLMRIKFPDQAISAISNKK